MKNNFFLKKLVSKRIIRERHTNIIINLSSMETLSASLKLPSLPPSSSSSSQPLIRSISHRFHVSSSSSASSTTQIHLPPSSSSSSSHNKNPNFPRSISFHAKASKSPPLVYNKAATGFAAALVSVCQSKNCLGRTQEDVRRLMEILVGEEKKRNKLVSVNDVVVEERGKFGKHLKGLVKMLISKGKLEILIDVLMEFERICDELVFVGATKLVWGLT